MKERIAWWIAVGFLIGYLFAWGTISIDRHLILESQKALQQEITNASLEVNRLREELRLKEIIEEAEFEMQKAIKWNREALEQPQQPVQLPPMGVRK